MNFLDIRQKLENIDYAWTKPRAYLVFVPGLSLLIQKIQLATTLPFPHEGDVKPENGAQSNAKLRRFATICKWHLWGSTSQIIASIIAIQAFANPLFLLLAALATYEMVGTLMESFKHKVPLFQVNTDSSPSASPTHCLPVELLTKIFELLPGPDLARSSQVCHLWKDVTESVASHVFKTSFKVAHQRLSSSGCEINWPKALHLWSSRKEPWGLQQILTLEGYGLASLADGRLAVASADDSVHIWSLDGMKEPRVLRGHTGLVGRFASLADGRLASGSFDGTVRIWSLDGSKEPLVLKLHTGVVKGLASLADGRLAVGYEDDKVHIWSLDGTKEPLVLREDKGTIMCLASLADGRLASGSFDGTVRLWSLDGTEEPLMLIGHSGFITCLAPLADGRFATCSGVGTVRIWDWNIQEVQKAVPEGLVIKLFEAVKTIFHGRACEALSNLLGVFPQA